MMRADASFAGVGLAALAAVGAALVSQHAFGMQPCAWCVLQRLVFVLVALACVLGLVWRTAAGRRVAAGLGALLALSGVASASWQHVHAAASASCAMTLADRIVSAWLGLDRLAPEVFEARASCADAAVSLLHVPYDVWSLGLFAIAALVLGATALGRTAVLEEGRRSAAARSAPPTRA